MNLVKSALAGIAISAASSIVSAATYALPALDPLGDEVSFSSKITSSKNSFFSDVYEFNIGTTSNFNSGVQSTANLKFAKTFGLDITNFSILNTATNTTYIGTKDLSSGTTVMWNISDQILGTGSYRLLIGGQVLGNSGGTYYGTLNVSPVPEPETYLMMLAGLAVVGVTVRRSKNRFASTPA